MLLLQFSATIGGATPTQTLRLASALVCLGAEAHVPRSCSACLLLTQGLLDGSRSAKAEFMTKGVAPSPRVLRVDNAFTPLLDAQRSALGALALP